MRRIAFLLIFICFLRKGYAQEIDNTCRLFPKTVTGRLRIIENGCDDPYEVYFHVPIPTHHQTPVFLKVESPQLIDYRFLPIGPPNWIVCARMMPVWESEIQWTAHVLLTQENDADLPESIPYAMLDQLPESVKPWLRSTDCVQCDADIVVQTVQALRDSSDDIIGLADRITETCANIPWTFSHDPIAFDAVYALNWGGTCVGRAHAGAALFRACGIPARVLLNLPSGCRRLDMHWNIEYFLPDYGWVKSETSAGQNPWPAQNDVVTLVCRPEDEFPVFQSDGAEGYWFTSNPSLSYNPIWAQAHNVYDGTEISASVDSAELAFNLADSAFALFSQRQGVLSNPAHEEIFQNAATHQKEAYDRLRNGDLSGFIQTVRQALMVYQSIIPAPWTTLFFDDFETESQVWSHGGENDVWESGQPSYGPDRAHSGSCCWGVDLDGPYPNDADCWLVSPVIDLTQAEAAFMQFWIWNSVEDDLGFLVYDPLWIEISADESEFHSIVRHMGGVNDDPDIPQSGGWTRIVLDLIKYTGNRIRIRFRFRSDGSTGYPGSYIDDVGVYARMSSDVEIQSTENVTLHQNTPNPFNASTRISYDLPSENHVFLDIVNPLGQRICTLVDEFQGAGIHSVLWRPLHLGAGLYIYRLKTGRYLKTQKCLLVK